MQHQTHPQLRKTSILNPKYGLFLTCFLQMRILRILFILPRSKNSILLKSLQLNPKILSNLLSNPSFCISAKSTLHGKILTLVLSYTYKRTFFQTTARAFIGKFKFVSFVLQPPGAGWGTVPKPFVFITYDDARVPLRSLSQRKTKDT